MNTKLSNIKYQAKLEAFEPPSHHKKHSAFIYQVMEVLKLVSANPKRYLHRLQFLNRGGERLRNRPWVEAACKILQIMVYYTDLRTMTVGVPGSEGLTIKFIAKHAGIGFKRCCRIMKDLQLSEYLETKKRCVRYQEGVFKGLPSIKKLSLIFFLHLGFKKEQIDKVKIFKENQYREIKQRAESLKQFHLNEYHRIRSKVIKGYNAAKDSTEDIPRKITDIFKHLLPKS